MKPNCPEEDVNGFVDPGSQTSHSSLSPQSFGSPGSDEILAVGENERGRLFEAQENSPSSANNFSSQSSGDLANCSLTAKASGSVSKNDSNRDNLTCNGQRSFSYDSNNGFTRDRVTYKPYGNQENNSLFLGSILDGLNSKTLDNYSSLSFIPPTSSRSQTTLPILTSSGSSLDYSSRTDYSTKPGFYGSFNDSPIYSANPQSFNSLKNTGGYAVQNNVSSFYQTNQQAYNPFGSSSSYGTQASCDYGNAVSGLGHHTGNLTANRTYGYVGTPDLWNGTGSTIGYDAPGVAVAAAATGVAAAAAAAAAINYGASMNHHSSYMAGIAASQYG